MFNFLHSKFFIAAAIVLAVGFAGTRVWSAHNDKSADQTATTTSKKVVEEKDTPAKETPVATTPVATTPAPTTPAVTAPKIVSHGSGPCAGASDTKAIVVSISSQHMWGCTNYASVYDSPVITGMQMYPSELTPKGTYTFLGKSVNQTLNGSDFTGSWSDFVYYWMPFLTNKYGTYGFHDLTDTKNGAAGRAEADFGAIDINQPYTAPKHGSHGCVEMPLAAMKWVYDWATVGTTINIVS